MCLPVLLAAGERETPDAPSLSVFGQSSAYKVPAPFSLGLAPVLFRAGDASEFDTTASGSGAGTGRFTAAKVRDITALALLASGWIGVSIWMREARYADRREDNWWGGVNGTFGMAFAGGVLGTQLERILLGEDVLLNDNAVDFYFIFGGLIAGMITSFLPPVTEAFRENPFLYYAYPAFLSIVSTIAIIEIWPEKKPRHVPGNSSGGVRFTSSGTGRRTR